MAAFESQGGFSDDVEKTATDEHLQNTTIKNFTWENITVTVKDVKTKLPKALLQGVSGTIKAGTLYVQNCFEKYCY